VHGVNPTKNDYMHHPTMRTSVIKPLFSRIPLPWVRDARLRDCACGLLLLRHASQRYFEQNVRVAEEWTTGVCRFQACEFRRRRGRQMFIALGGLSLLVSFKRSVTIPDILPWSFRPIYEALFLPWGHSIIEVLRRVVIHFYSVLFLLPLRRG